MILNRFAAPFLLSMLALSTSSSAAGGASPAAKPDSASSLAATLDGIVDSNATAHGIPAQAVLVMRSGHVVYQHYTGMLTVGGRATVGPDTAFPIFSVSKLFAAVLLYQEVERGHVDLDAPASRYVKMLPAAWRAITVREFLDHVSGVPEYFDGSDFSKPFAPTLEGAFARIADAPFFFKTNTDERYTQTNFLVIEALLEAVTGKPYHSLVQSRIVGPLGLKNLWYAEKDVPKGRLAADYRGDKGRIVPDPLIGWPPYAQVHTGICATAADLARFLDAVASGRFVSKVTLQRLWRPHIVADGETGDFASGWDYGVHGPWHEVGHDGAAKLRVRVLFQRDPGDHVVIVYLTNGTADNVWSRKLVDSVQAQMLPAPGAG